MNILDTLLEGAKSLIPSGIVIVGFIFVLFAVRYILEKKYSSSEGYVVRRQLITIFLSLIGLLVIILVSPLSDTKQGQLISLIGLLLSAAIALSSTTFVGNAMAGMMLRAVKSFRPGDFINVGEFFGRVSERGLFHTEIQTEDRDLTTLPNLYLVTNPVKVIRASGTIVWSEVSLGYDIPRNRIEELLLKAALDTGLRDPFVYVMNLRDFSVTYRISGMLEEVKHLLSARSSLRKMVLDNLHQGGIEIVSPTFMNTRSIVSGKEFIPKESRVYHKTDEPIDTVLPEDLVFDKADQAESIEKLRARLDSIGQEIDKLKSTVAETSDPDHKEKLKKSLEQIKTRREKLTEYIKMREKDSK